MKKLIATAVLSSVMLIAGNVMADSSATWFTPAEGTYCVGSQVTLTGSAAASGGTGMDLVLVLDSSGSMSFNNNEGLDAQRAAAHALVNSLTPSGTSVGVIEFDSSSSTVQTLVGLTSNITDVHTAIDSVDAQGGTNIGFGVAQGTTELIGSNHIDGRQQIMIVMSDGDSLGDPAAAADAAMLTGIDAIHTVGMGSSMNPTELIDMVDGTDNAYGTTDDYGIYSSSSMANLTALLTSGALVGIDTVNITDGYGVDVAFTMSGLGDITITDYTMLAGANIFIMDVLGTDGSSASAQWTLTGVECPTNPVPEPGTMLLMGTGLTGLLYSRRRKAGKKS